MLGRGEADLEPFGFAGPALFVGFGDAGDQVVGDPGQSQPLSRVNAGSTRSSGHLTQLSLNSEPNFHGPADLPEFDPKGGIPSSVVADFRRIVASTWASLSLTPV